MVRNILIGLGIFIFVIVVVLLVVVLRKPAKTTTLEFPKEPVTLTYWRLFDDGDVFKPLLEGYKQQHPNVTINYVLKNYDTYYDDLLNALAAGTGPDLFMLKSDWIPKHLDKLAPSPEGFSLTQQSKKEPKKDIGTQFKEQFVKVVPEALIFNSKAYGVPLFVDTLGLYYNPSLFDEASQKHRQVLSQKEGQDVEIERIGNLLRKPPQNWNDFIEVVKLLTEKDQRGNIKMSGVAMGTAKNTQKASDILSLLMLQNNTQMVTVDKKSASFNLSVKNKNGELIYPGTLALDFYTSFARPNKETYTFNETLPDSVQAFGEGKAAMMVNYSYYMPILKKQFPDLQFEVAPLPQIKGATDRADYAYFWPEVVAKSTKYPQVAWDFLAFISNQDNLREYNQTTQRPFSRLDFAKEAAGEGFKDATGLAVFNGQSLSAISWYQGGESKKIDEVFQNMIGAVVEKGQNFQAAIDSAAASVTNILGQAEPLIEKEKEEP